MIKAAGRTLGAGVLIAGLAAAALPAAAKELGGGGPTARATQYAPPPWDCRPITLRGYGSSAKHRVPTWGPGSGLRFYTISFSVSAEKCRNTTRVIYALYADASGLPSDRSILLQLQSSGPRNRWRPACVRQYGSGKLRCLFEVKGGTKVPRFGARPIVQFRTTAKSLITNTRMPNGVVQTGAGSWVSGPPKTYYAGLRWWRAR